MTARELTLFFLWSLFQVNAASTKATARAVEWAKANPERAARNKRRYYEKNLEVVRKRSANWRRDNREDYNRQMRDWRLANREYRNTWLKLWRASQVETNPQYRLAGSVRTRLRDGLRGKNKSARSQDYLGCTWSEFRNHIESLWLSGMSWKNYGNKLGCWSIDHIQPLAKFDLSDDSQLRAVSHFSNQRPLWHVDNMAKGAR